MKQAFSSVSGFLHDESGPTSVEYCFMLGFIVLVCFATIGALGQATLGYYTLSLSKMP